MAWKRQRSRSLDLALLQSETAQLQVETLRTELQELHRELARRDVELISALTRLAAVTDRLRLQTDEDRVGRIRLARAIELLGMFAISPVPRAASDALPPPTAPPVTAYASATAPPVPPSPPPAAPTPRAAYRDADPAPPPPPPPAVPGVGTVIGGSVDPTRATEPAPGTIDLTAEVAADLPIAPSTRQEAPLQCEVHLQFGDRWIDGFQIEETIRAGDVIQFRLRRRVDGWVLPELFAESEVRVFTQPVVDPT